MKKIGLFILLAFFTLSCGLSATLPTDILAVKSALPTEYNTVILQPTESKQVFTVCNSGGLRLRSAAGTANSELAILADGEIVSRTDTPAKYPVVIAWYEVVTESGLKGWVMSKYLVFGTECK